MKKLAAALAAATIAVLALAGCSGGGGTADRQDQYTQLETKSEDRTPPDVSGDTEYNNYIKAQELYDDPSSIIWCTAFPPSDAAPIFTTPIAGKLTSSSVSYFPSRTQDFSLDGTLTWSEENRSVDGMYHGTPGPYRYGFTPGGQYVDYTGLEVFCTTQLTEFQRQTLTVSAVAAEDAVTAEAEAKLQAGDPQGAQDLLDGIGQ